MRRISALAAVIGMIAVFGCAGLADLGKKESYHDITKAYAHSMRWSDFDTATLFVRQPGLPDTESLNNIKITSYEVKQHLVIQEGSRIRQVARVAYFKKSDMLLKTVSVEEIWKFDEEDEQWYLVKGFPDFE